MMVMLPLLGLMNSIVLTDLSACLGWLNCILVQVPAALQQATGKAVVPIRVFDWESILASSLPRWTERMKEFLAQGRLLQAMQISADSYEVLI
ncbi:hypothetical protein LINGRAHAP2_LOCUS34400 [Linum grandiflorum]